MKLMVITNEHGHIIATAQVAGHDGSDRPSGGRPVAEAGHRVHELDWSDQLARCGSADELHAAVAVVLHSSKTSS